MEPEVLQELATELLGDRPVGARVLTSGSQGSKAGADGALPSKKKAQQKKAEAAGRRLPVIKELTFSNSQIGQHLTEKLPRAARQWCLAGSKVLGRNSLGLYDKAKGITKASSSKHIALTSADAADTALGQEGGAKHQPHLNVNETQIANCIAELDSLTTALSANETNQDVEGESRLSMLIASFEMELGEPTVAELFPGTGTAVALTSALPETCAPLAQWVYRNDDGTGGEGSFAVNPESLTTVATLKAAAVEWATVAQAASTSEDNGDRKGNAPLPSDMAKTKVELLDMIHHAETRASIQVQRIHDESWKQVQGFLRQIGVWSLRRESLANQSKDHTRDCDFQQDIDYKSVTTLTASFIEKAQAIKNKQPQGYTGSARAHKAEVDKQRSQLLMSMMGEWENNLTMLHQKWTDTFITDFARATINNLADHTDKLLASLNTAAAELKGAKLGAQTRAMLTVVKTEAVAAVEAQRERLEQGVLNALSAAHGSKLKKMQDELGSCTEQLILAEAYADKVALLGNKEFKRKLKKIEKMMEGGRSNGVHRIVKAASDPIVIAAALAILKALVEHARGVEHAKLEQYMGEIVETRKQFEVQVEQIQASTATRLSAGRDHFLLCVGAAVYERLSDLFNERIIIAKQEALLGIQADQDKAAARKKKKELRKAAKAAAAEAAAEMDRKVQELRAMDYKEKACRNALDASQGDLQEAKEWLADNSITEAEQAVANHLAAEKKAETEAAAAKAAAKEAAVEKQAKQAQEAERKQAAAKDAKDAEAAAVQADATSAISTADSQQKDGGKSPKKQKKKPHQQHQQQQQHHQQQQGTASGADKTGSSKKKKKNKDSSTNEPAAASVPTEATAAVAAVCSATQPVADRRPTMTIDPTRPYANLSRGNLEEMVTKLLTANSHLQQKNGQLETKVAQLSEQLSDTQKMLIATNQVVSDQMELQIKSMGVPGQPMGGAQWSVGAPSGMSNVALPLGIPITAGQGPSPGMGMVGGQRRPPGMGAGGLPPAFIPRTIQPMESTLTASQNLQFVMNAQPVKTQASPQRGRKPNAGARQQHQGRGNGSGGGGRLVGRGRGGGGHRGGGTSYVPPHMRQDGDGGGGPGGLVHF